jgi:hypothetical protein
MKTESDLEKESTYEELLDERNCEIALCKIASFVWSTVGFVLVILIWLVLIGFPQMVAQAIRRLVRYRISTSN